MTLVHVVENLVGLEEPAKLVAVGLFAESRLTTGKTSLRKWEIPKL